MRFSKKILDAIEKHKLNESDVIIILSVVVQTGSIESLTERFQIGEIMEVTDLFCDFDAEKDTTELKAEFKSGWETKNAWKELLAELKKNYGFNNQFPSTSFNIYTKGKNVDETLWILLLDGYTIEQIAKEVASYYSRTQMPTGLSKFIVDSLASSLQMRATTKIRGLV